MSRPEAVAAADAVVVRRASSGDAEAVCAVHKASVRGLCAGRYSPEQIEAWIGDRRPEHYRHAVTDGGEVMVVAERRGGGGGGAGIVGFASLQGAEVVAVYVLPAEAGRGTGAALLRAIEREARARGVDRLHLSASLNAVPFYEAMGYRPVHATTFFLPGRIELEAVGMEKALGRAPRPAV